MAIDVPANVRDGAYCVVSLSGGKDSVATALALREAGVPFSLAFADTGWEAPETYAHLDAIERHLGPIHRVQAKRGGMVEHILQRAGFPARMQRWCTRELKIEPLRAWHNTIERWLPGRETVCVVGIRAEESEARAKMLTWEDDDQWGGWMWRPILAWTIEDVLTIHHRHGVPLNPLYRRGHDRVGCFPCIISRKEEVRLIAEQAPERIDLIRSLERDIALERASRNATTPGRYKHPIGTFFQSVDRDGAGVMPIDDVVTWARTERGGRQLPMFDADPTGGCFRWGMCEPPKAAE